MFRKRNAREWLRTGQDRTGQDRTGQDRTGQDRTGEVGLGSVGKRLLCRAMDGVDNISL